MRTLPVLYKVPRLALSVPLTPQFFGFFAVFHPFFKNFFAPTARLCPPCAESPCRALAQPQKPRNSAAKPPIRASPLPQKSPAKRLSRTLENPPLTPLHIKKLSKVRSTLLTPLPGECILEYMRLKESRRPPRTGRHAQHPRLQNFQTIPPRIRRSGALTPKE